MFVGKSWRCVKKPFIVLTRCVLYQQELGLLVRPWVCEQDVVLCQDIGCVGKRLGVLERFGVNL